MERKTEIYYLLIHEGLIASRISERLGIGRAAVSKQIKKLSSGGFIQKAENFLEHNKQLKQVAKGSATGKCNAYVQGPNSKLLEDKIRENKTSEGGARGAEARSGADDAIDNMDRLADEWQINRLPGGRDPYIDVHRIDYTLRVVGIVNEELFSRKVGIDFAEPKTLMRGNWGTWGPLEIATGAEGELGWNAYINRQFTKKGDELNWLANATSVRLTLPKRIWITPEQARIEGLAKSLINNGLWECINYLGKEYGIQFGLPKERQSEEYGVLWNDPSLAKRVKDEGVVHIADGIHADDSHGLASEGIVHIDTDSPVKAADVANPLAAFAGGMKGMREFFDNAQTILNETTVMMEERLLDSADRLAQINQDHVGIVVEQMSNSWQDKMDGFIKSQEDIWAKERDTFFEKQRKAFDKIVEHFQEKYGRIFQERAEGQSVLEDWIAFEKDNQ
jgi:predicted transcriptional regulator